MNNKVEMIQKSLLRLAPAFVESVRITKFGHAASGTFDILRAGRADPFVIRETRRIMAELPEGVLERFKACYKNRDPADRRVKSKYYNLPVHIAHAVWQAKELGLYEAGRKLRIVDLGTGFGYFPLVCDSIGHTATGLDWDRWKVYEGISKDIRIDRREWVVTPDEPMPEIDMPVDVVTAFRPVFYYDFEHDTLWAEQKWNRFFRNLERQLHEQGTVYIGRNRLSDGQKSHFEVMAKYFKRIGAIDHQHGWLFRASSIRQATAS